MALCAGMEGGLRMVTVRGSADFDETQAFGGAHARASSSIHANFTSPISSHPFQAWLVTTHLLSLPENVECGGTVCQLGECKQAMVVWNGGDKTVVVGGLSYWFPDPLALIDAANDLLASNDGLECVQHCRTAGTCTVD